MVKHEQKTILKEISKLTPLKYNQFFWWRKFKEKSPLSTKDALHSRIDNGDFDFSSYYWQAQYALIEMEEKTNHILYPDTRHEAQQIFRERYRRLMKDFEKDEPLRITNYKKNITNTFDIEDKELEELMENFEGSLRELYNFIKTNYNFRTTRKRKK